jgi:serine/threonine protein kinase
MPEIITHPSAQALALFGSGKLSDAQAVTVATHLETCADCRGAVENLPPDSFLGKVRAAKPGGTVLPAPTGRPSGASVAGAPGPAVPVPDLPPELADHPKFRILRELGRGGMGVIYEAEHRVMEKSVALKVISPAVLDNPDALARFQAEVKAAGALDHPNIARAYDADQAGGLHFLVMEFVEGVNLAQVLEKRGPLPVASACHCVRQAALGLQHAFEKGMVHRDIKPHNLMLTPRGVVKVLDFGLARVRDERKRVAPRLTRLESFMGTPTYVAPEQAVDARQADTRSDIYSLGCTLYALLAGRPPFVDNSAVIVIMAHLEKEPPPLHELRPDVPAELSAVVAKMLAKDPAQRFQRPVEAAQALAPFIKKAKSPEHRDPAPAELAVAPEPFDFTTDATRVPRRGPGSRATDHGRPELLKEVPARFRGRRLFVIATAILFLLAGLLGAAVYRIATDKGGLVIETDNDDVEVVVSKGGQVVKIIDTKSGKHITLNSGDYELALKDGPEGLKLSPGKMTVKRGETVLATITRAGNPGAALPERPPAKRPPEGLVAWWRADGNAKDSAGDNHGSLKGEVKFAPGVAGQAFDFDGISGRIDLGNAPSLHLSSGDFSVSAWVNFRSLKPPPGSPDSSGDMWIVAKMYFAAGPNTDGWALLKQRDNHFWFGFGGGNANGLGGDAAPTMIRSTTSVEPGVWYHVVAVKTAGHFSLYVNGIKEALLC